MHNWPSLLSSNFRCWGLATSSLTITSLVLLRISTLFMAIIASCCFNFNSSTFLVSSNSTLKELSKSFSGLCRNITVDILGAGCCWRWALIFSLFYILNVRSYLYQNASYYGQKALFWAFIGIIMIAKLIWMKQKFEKKKLKKKVEKLKNRLILAPHIWELSDMINRI